MHMHKTVFSVAATLAVGVTGSISGPRAYANGLDLLVVGEVSGSVLRYHGGSGAFISAFVSPGSGGLCQGMFVGPGGMVFGSDGHLYVTCDSGEAGLVLRYDGVTGNPLPGVR